MQVVAGLAAPVEAAADGEPVPLAGQVVGGEGLQAVARYVGEDALVVVIGAHAVGVAAGELPAGRQLAVQFHFHTLGGGALLGGVGNAVPDRQVVLLDLEQRQAGSEAAFVERGLHPGFIAGAFFRIERLVVHVANPGALRIEDLGVAGIQRPDIVQRVGHAGVGDEHAAFAFLVLGVRA
ncbi:hypothetical protein D9M71_377340 [compost metagenome]